MSLAGQVGLLATKIANTLRDSYKPRLLPAGGTAGQVLTKTSATDFAAAWAAASGGTDATVAQDLIWFGDGSDGDLTVSSGTTTLTRDVFYRNLTLSGSAVLDTAGYRVHVLGAYDESGLTSGWIGRTPNPGNNATATAGAAAAVALAARTLGGGLVSLAGTAGAAATGTANGSTTFNAGSGAGSCGKGGIGGNGSTGTGGTTATPTIPAPLLRLRRPAVDLLYGAATLGGAAWGAGGGAGGGGDGTNAGGGAGAGGGGGAVVAIYARTIIRGASTGAATIRARGAKGGNGFSPATGSVGGGGGGAGGGGGFVTVVYRFLTGTIAPSAIDVSGGDGGNGGSGNGTGTAGRGGGAGWGGFVSLFNLTTGASTTFLGPQSNSDPTGQTGETAAVAQTSL